MGMLTLASPHHQHLCLNSSEQWVLHYTLHSAPFDPGTFATLMPAQYKTRCPNQSFPVPSRESLSSPPWFQIRCTTWPLHFVPFDSIRLTLWSVHCTNRTHQSFHTFVFDRQRQRCEKKRVQECVFLFSFLLNFQCQWCSIYFSFLLCSLILLVLYFKMYTSWKVFLVCKATVLMWIQMFSISILGKHSDELCQKILLVLLWCN